MGVDGVAWPSVVSRVVAAALILRKCYREDAVLTVPKTLRLDGGMAKRILGIGIPSAFENSLFEAGRILVVSMISTFGTVQIAANAVANNLDGMGVIPGKAISLAMITVVGRCIGAGDHEQTVYYTRKLLLWAYITMGLSNGAILLFLRQLVASTPFPARPWSWPLRWSPSTRAAPSSSGRCPSCCPTPCARPTT